MRAGPWPHGGPTGGPVSGEKVADSGASPVGLALVRRDMLSELLQGSALDGHQAGADRIAASEGATVDDLYVPPGERDTRMPPQFSSCSSSRRISASRMATAAKSSTSSPRPAARSSSSNPAEGSRRSQSRINQNRQ